MIDQSCAVVIVNWNVEDAVGRRIGISTGRERIDRPVGARMYWTQSPWWNIGVESKLDCCVASAEDSASPAGNEVTSPVWAAEFHAALSADGRKNELGPMPELLKPSATDASTSISRSSTVSVAAAITERPANKRK
ncbi:MAG: hypothetical protein R3E58_13250 [Phycisphaerae bacterium]